MAGCSCSCTVCAVALSEGVQVFIATATTEVPRTAAAIEVALQALALEVVTSLADQCGVEPADLDEFDIEHALMPADSITHAIVSVQGTARSPQRR